MKQKIDPVIARRELKSRIDEGRVAVVTIGRPRKAKTGEWICPFRIEGLGKPQLAAAHGEDSLQALLMAIEGIRVNLDSSGRGLFWLDADFGPGIPRYVPWHFGPSFEERILAAIQREQARCWEQKLKVGEVNVKASEVALGAAKEAIADWEARLNERKEVVTHGQAILKASKSQQTRRR
jgi:Domain of unknown function (DUF6968)